MGKSKKVKERQRGSRLVKYHWCRAGEISGIERDNNIEGWRVEREADDRWMLVGSVADKKEGEGG